MTASDLESTLKNAGAICIVGARGQLGCELQKIFANQRVIPLTRDQLDVTDPAQTSEVIRQCQPDVVINCTAFNRVDDAEADPAPAFAVNAFGTRNVSQAAARAGAAFLHVSTDYVFDGSKGGPYVESDVPFPANAYGISKLAGELFARNECKSVTIVRTSALYGVGGRNQKGGRGNFVEMILRRAASGESLRVVNDQITSPTYARDLAERIGTIVGLSARGIHHAANAGECTWYEFARAIVTMAGLNVQVESVTTDEFAELRGMRPARRPRQSVLISEREKELGLNPLRTWRDALAAYLKEREAAI